MFVRVKNLSGLNYPNDINISITGLRPGEKLYEELLANDENTMPTHHPKIMIGKFNEQNCELLEQKIEELCIMNLFDQDSLVVAKIKEIVPEYISKNSAFEKLDKKVERDRKIFLN